MLFDEQVARKPNLYPWTDDYIKRLWTTFWTPEEFNFNGDYSQFHNVLSAEEQKIIVRTLSAIGQVEIAVKKFWARLGDNLPHPSINDLGLVMANTEVIHNKAYEKLLDRLGLVDAFDELLQEPVMRDRVKYLKKHLDKVYGDDRKQYVYSIILFTLYVENASLFSQFYIILWFSRFRNVLKDTAQQVAYTRQEESLHSQIGIKIINTLREEYPELFSKDLVDKVRRETKTAFESECSIIDWIVGDYNDDKFSAEILKAYVGQRINDSLSACGFSYRLELDDDALSHTQWMEEELYGNSHTDFFHRTPIDYAKHNKAFKAEELF